MNCSTKCSEWKEKENLQDDSNSVQAYVTNLMMSHEINKATQFSMPPAVTQSPKLKRRVNTDIIIHPDNDPCRLI